MAWESVALEEIGGDDYDCAPRQGWASKKLGGGQIHPLLIDSATSQRLGVFIGSYNTDNGLNKFDGEIMSGRHFEEGFQPASNIPCSCECEATCFTELLELPVSRIVKL